MFGSNEENECMTFDDGGSVTIPQQIDDIIKEKTKAQSIIDIIPGYYTTTIVCE